MNISNKFSRSLVLVLFSSIYLLAQRTDIGINIIYPTESGRWISKFEKNYIGKVKSMKFFN